MTTASGLKYAVKWTVAQAMYRLGLFHVWKRAILGSRAIVLTYHRVLSADAAAATWSHPAIIVSRDTFAMHLAVLRRTFRVLSLAEFETALHSGRGFEGPSCLITFDDGWRDTYSEAWPLLKKFGLPAVAFLPVGYIGSDQAFWQEELGHVLFQTWDRARTDRALAERARAILRDARMGDLLDAPPEQSMSMVVDRVRGLKADASVDTGQLLERLRDALGGAGPPQRLDRFMSWDEVRQMAADGVSFGAHSETHRILTRLPSAEVIREATVSKSRIEDELRTDVTAFSYPDGKWNHAAVDAVRAARYRLAFSMDRGAVSTADDHYRMRRVNIHEDVSACVPMFLARVLGVF